MAKSEIVKAMTDSQKNEIVETMLGAMPSLNFGQAQAIIGNKAPFVSGISALFEPYLGSKPMAKPTNPALPTEFTVGGRIYELVSLLKKGEGLVMGNTMVERAQELNANLGKEDGEFILEHQDEIPQEYRGKFHLVFTDWRDLSNPKYIAYLDWDNGRWCQIWGWLTLSWIEYDRLVRRRK